MGGRRSGCLGSPHAAGLPGSTPHRQTLHESPGHTLQTTALANEAYLPLVDVRKVSRHDRAHFIAICANTMRRILVDFASSRGYQKQDGGEEPLSLVESLDVARGLRSDLLIVDDALTRLVEHDPKKSQVVELRFLGGPSAEETADALKISSEMVMRGRKIPKAWLHHDLGGKKKNGA